MSATLPVTQICLVCDTRFRSSSGSCPTCRSALEQTLADLSLHPGLDMLRVETQMALQKELQTPLPTPVPWAAIAVGGVASLVVAFIAAWFRWETGYWLILAFPAAIGFVGGAAGLLMTLREQSVVRAYAMYVPVLIGILAFASTFWAEYEFTVNALEDLGYVEVRERLPFGTFIKFKAEEPLSISRRGATYADDEGSPGASYTLWTVEAAAAGVGGYLGWRKALGWLRERAAT